MHLTRAPLAAGAAAFKNPLMRKAQPSMAGDADRPLAMGAHRTAARLPPSWFRERDADELAREAAQLARMQQLERDAIAAGYNVRPIKR